MLRTLVLACAAGMAAALAPAAGAAPPADLAPAPNLDDLLGDLEATPAVPEGRVRLDAWVQAGDRGRELVVVVDPEGETRLIADPGITFTSEDGVGGVEWQVPLPHRVVEPRADYWEGERAIRVPFRAAEGTPLDFTVEYAWCVLDFQCFFGEESLSVTNRIN